MFNRVIIENSEMLETVPNQYKTQEMCNKAVDNYAHALGLVYHWYKIKKYLSKMLIVALLQ